MGLFSSFGTLLCCAIPSTLVLLGFGATLASFLGNFPQLIWLSENKLWIFGAGAALLILGGVLQWKVRSAACPIDPRLAKSCSTTRDWSPYVYASSVVIYLIGATFAFILPLFM